MDQMKIPVRKLLAVLIALSFLQAAPAQAGWLKNFGALGVAVAGADTAVVAAATVDAIAVAGTATYVANLANLKSHLAAHRIVGPVAVRLGIATWLRLEPRRLAAALAVKTDSIGSGRSGSAQPTSLGNSATGDPNDEEPEQPGIVVVKRPLRPDDLGLQPENVTKLQGEISLEGRTLTVRVDMIQGAPSGGGNFTLETAGPKIINSLRTLASENGATTLRIEASFANARLLQMFELRYGASVQPMGSYEVITLPVS